MPHDIKAMLAHIKRLEEKLAYFMQHHHRCHLATHVSPPVADDTYNSDGDHDELASPGLRIIPFNPEHTELPKTPISNTRWRKVADQLLKHAPFAEQWSAWTKQLKLSETHEKNLVIAAICGVPAQVPQVCEKHMINSKVTGVIALAQAYARATKESQGNATLAFRLQTFQELVFVSLCSVLETVGCPLHEVNETMRIWVSDSEDKNLKRLRRGAVWANQRISELDTALEGYATEWFFNRTYTGIVVEDCMLTSLQMAFPFRSTAC